MVAKIIVVLVAAGLIILGVIVVTQQVPPQQGAANCQCTCADGSTVYRFAPPGKDCSVFVGGYCGAAGNNLIIRCSYQAGSPPSE